MITDNPLKSKIDLEKNPKGTELKVALQREREKSGRYVSIPGDKSHTKILSVTEKIQKNGFCLSSKRLITELQCGIRYGLNKKD
nr:MAG: hypothetical protein [Bacteriophage sp.]